MQRYEYNVNFVMYYKNSKSSLKIPTKSETTLPPESQQEEVDDSCVKCFKPKCEGPWPAEPEKEKMPEDEAEKCPIVVIRRAVLKETNKYRRMHCAAPLKVLENLQEYAQQWADFLAENDLLETRPMPRFGENILCALKSRCYVPHLIKLWYQEKYNYDYLNPGFDLYSGHFTQMIWWESTSIGVGVAANESKYWIVCNYHPAGNIRGHYKENVLPRKLMLSDSEPEDEKPKKPCAEDDEDYVKTVPDPPDPALRAPCENTITYRKAPDHK